jgi:hypothetical protein
MRWLSGLSAAAAIVLAAGTAMADVVTDWNQIALDSVQATGTPPPRAARNLAMVHGAVYDAVNSITGTHSNLFGYFGDNTGASHEAAAVCAAHDVLVSLYPARAAIFNAARDNHLALIGDGAAKAAGISTGEVVATVVLANRASDGNTGSSSYAPINAPGRWRVGPDNPSGPALAHWMNVTPFAIASGSQFRAPAAPGLLTAQYAASTNEVKAIGSATSATRTAEQTDIAHAWAFNAGTITPPGAWNKIGQELGSANSVAENARMFAMLNIALADAGIAAWDTKYTHDVWRPIHAIREADSAGNGAIVQDPSWLPLLSPTPNHPTYVSGHSTFSRAAADILAAFLGTDSINVAFDGDFGVMRQLTSLDDAANEAGLSRIYGGIHFDFDNTWGQNIGASVADWVVSNYFLPVPAPGAMALLGVGLIAAARRRR